MICLEAMEEKDLGKIARGGGGWEEIHGCLRNGIGKAIPRGGI